MKLNYILGNFLSRKNILVLLFVITGICSADSFIIFTGSGYNYDEIFKEMTDVSFGIGKETKSTSYCLYPPFDFITAGMIFFDEVDIQTIRNTLRKYLEWESIAIKKQVEIDKELPNSQISGRVSFKYVDDWYSGADNITITFEVHSYSYSRNKKLHRLVLSSNKVTSCQNKYIGYQLERLYLDHAQVVNFLKGISPKAIKAAEEAFIKKKKAQDLFQ